MITFLTGRDTGQYGICDMILIFKQDCLCRLYRENAWRQVFWMAMAAEGGNGILQHAYMMRQEFFYRIFCPYWRQINPNMHRKCFAIGEGIPYSVDMEKTT